MFIKEMLQNKENFSNIECLIADHLLAIKEDIVNESARHIAEVLYISPPSIIRVCQKLGYKGYNDFKEAYLKELQYFSSHFQDIDPNFPFSMNDEPVIVTRKLSKLYQETIQDTMSIFDQDTFQEAIHKLTEAKNITICTSGIHLELAEIFKYRLSLINKNVSISHHMTDTFYRASFSDRTSCFLFISYSGETDQIVHIAKKVKQRQLPAIAITSLGNNTLSDIINCSLCISTREKLHDNIGSFCSNLSVLFVLDSLYANLFRKDYIANIANKKQSAIEFERYRKSSNPLLMDE